LGFISIKMQKINKWKIIESKGHKKIEEELKESENRYRTVSKLATDWIFSNKVLPDGSMVVDWATEGLTRITGRTLDEIKNPEVWKNMVYPDNLDAQAKFFQTILSGEKASYEAHIKAKDGKEIWLLVHGKPEFDEHRKVVVIIGTGKDITKQKNAEKILKESEQILRKEIEERKRSEQELLDSNRKQQEIAQKLKDANIDLIEAQDEVTTTKDFLQNVIDSISDIIISIDLNGRIDHIFPDFWIFNFI